MKYPLNKWIWSWLLLLFCFVIWGLYLGFHKQKKFRFQQAKYPQVSPELLPKPILRDSTGKMITYSPEPRA